MRQYLLKFDQSLNWPDMSLRITGLSPKDRAHFQVLPDIADVPLRAVLGALEGGNLDLETICSLGFPQVALRPAQGVFDKEEAQELAVAMLADLLYESDVLYTIDIGPKWIVFSSWMNFENQSEPKLISGTTEQLARICKCYGFEAMRHGPSSRLLDVSVQGQVTRYQVIGSRNAKTVTIAPDIDAVVAMEYLDEILSENPNIIDCAVLSR